MLVVLSCMATGTWCLAAQSVMYYNGEHAWPPDCRYKELLAAKECPFTFYERDKEASAAKAARRAAAKDPNRFQVRCSYRSPQRRVRSCKTEVCMCEPVYQSQFCCTLYL
jgi:hypothetical protein